MFSSLLHRMILWELVKVFGMSLIGITGIMLMAGIVTEASQQGLGPTQILAAIPLLIPSTLPYTIPTTTLFATCVVYGRLAHDNEILAIKSAGVNVLQVVKPGLILGLAMSVGTMGLYYRIIPYTHRLLRMLAFEDAEELLYSVLKKYRVITHSKMPYAMWVDGVQGKKLLNPLFKKRGEGHNQGQTEVVATAREADLRVNMAKRELQIHMYDGVATSADGSRAYFKDRWFDVPLPPEWGTLGEPKPRDMTWQEILAERENELRKINELMTEVLLDPPQGQSANSSADEERQKKNKNLMDQVRVHQQKVIFLNVELQMRPALCLGCLCFILVGCPVGIWFGRSDYLSSFITCFLPIVVLYYPLILCGTGMAKEGRFDPIVLVWAADAFLGVIGLGLFWRLLKH